MFDVGDLLVAVIVGAVGGFALLAPYFKDLPEGITIPIPWKKED